MIRLFYYVYSLIVSIVVRHTKEQEKGRKINKRQRAENIQIFLLYIPRKSFIKNLSILFISLSLTPMCFWRSIVRDIGPHNKMKGRKPTKESDLFHI